jgi:hypothetical protein
MRDDLVCAGAIVLKDVVLNSTSGLDELLRDGLYGPEGLVSSNPVPRSQRRVDRQYQDLTQSLVRDVG